MHIISSAQLYSSVDSNKNSAFTGVDDDSMSDFFRKLLINSEICLRMAHPRVSRYISL